MLSLHTHEVLTEREAIKQKKVFEEIREKIFPSINLRCHQIPGRINLKKATPSHEIIRPLKAREKVLQQQEGKALTCLQRFWRQKSMGQHFYGPKGILQNVTVNQDIISHNNTL